MGVQPMIDGLRERMTMADTEAGALPPPNEVDAVVDRLAARFPSVDRSQLRVAVDDAVADLAHARVHQFLPILIERTAGSTLRRALDVAEEPCP